MSVTSALVPGGGFVPLLAAAAGRPASTPAQVLRAYAALDQLLLLKSEPSERSSAGGDDDGSGHIGSPTTLRGGPSGGAGPLEVGASLPECSMPPYRDSWNGGVASELQGAGPSRGAAPAARGKKRGPKRTVPNLEDLEAQLAQKQAEVQQLERRNVQLRRRKALLETVIACRDSQVARLQAQTAGGSHGVNEAHTLLSSAQAQLPHQPRCWQEYAEMPLEHMYANFKCLLATISDTLLALDPESPGASPASAAAAGQRLRCLTSASLLLFQNLLLTNPNLIRMAALNVHGEEQLASDSHWLGVAQVLMLSPEQLEDSSVLFELYRRWTDEVQRDRARLTHAIAELTGAKMQRAAVSLDAHSHAELQLLDRLQQSVDRQLCIICLVAEVFLTSVLSHVQFAQAVLSSHPHTLDSLSVLGACARLRAGACGGPDGTGGGQGQLSGSGASLEGPGPRTGRGGSGGGGGKGAGGRRK